MAYTEFDYEVGESQILVEAEGYISYNGVIIDELRYFYYINELDYWASIPETVLPSYTIEAITQEAVQRLVDDSLDQLADEEYERENDV